MGAACSSPWRTCRPPMREAPGFHRPWAVDLSKRSHPFSVEVDCSIPQFQRFRRAPRPERLAERGLEVLSAPAASPTRPLTDFGGKSSASGGRGSLGGLVGRRDRVHGRRTPPLPPCVLAVTTQLVLPASYPSAGPVRPSVLRVPWQAHAARGGSRSARRRHSVLLPARRSPKPCWRCRRSHGPCPAAWRDAWSRCRRATTRWASLLGCPTSSGSGTQLPCSCSRVPLVPGACQPPSCSPRTGRNFSPSSLQL